MRIGLTKGLGITFAAYLRNTFGSYSAALEARPQEWENEARVPARLFTAAHSKETTSRIAQVKKECRLLGMEIFHLGAPGYPEDLATIYDPPPVLYVKGGGSLAQLCSRAVAVIGTRKPTDRGLVFAKRLASELAREGIPVISGLAFGIDITAHIAALEADGIAIAVLPGPLDLVHPAAHAGWAERVALHGVLVSEHPPGARVTKGMFVARNRIMSGLSKGVAIIEAGTKSGTLRTAEFAVQQSRPVFVMPGRPDEIHVAGSLPLIRDGAHVLLSARDILETLRFDFTTSPPVPLPAELERARELLQAGSGLDDLLNTTGLDALTMLAVLGKLEVEGTVERDGEGRYHLSPGLS